MASRRISTESWTGRRQAAGELARRDRVAIANSTSRISELCGDIDGALIAFAEARRLEPNDIAALRKICRILFESQRWRAFCICAFWQFRGVIYAVYNTDKPNLPSTISRLRLLRIRLFEDTLSDFHVGGLSEPERARNHNRQHES